MKFIKLYHYSNTANLKFLDPAFYGSGVTRTSECRHGLSGLPKVYFYNQDQPESCVSSGSRQVYEVYFPYEWKSLIYDTSKDKLGLYDFSKAKLIAAHQRHPYEYELKEAFELAIKDAGFKGWHCSDFAPLPHALVLFDKISTQKPRVSYEAYDWDDNLIEIFQAPTLSTSPDSLFYPVAKRITFAETQLETWGQHTTTNLFTI